MKVTCKICTQYLQQIRVEARAGDFCGLVVDSLLRFADGINSAYKGTIKKYAKSGGIYDWAKEKFSFYQSPENSETANLSAKNIVMKQLLKNIILD